MCYNICSEVQYDVIFMDTKEVFGKMRCLLALFGIASFSSCVIACGGTGRSQSQSSSSHAAADRATVGRSTGTGISPEGSFLGDGDSDNPGDTDGDEVADHDADSDGSTPESKLFHDKDDEAIMSYGHAANAGDERTVTTFVKHFYAAALAENGTAACSTMPPVWGKEVVEDFGRRGTGPGYMYGKTCAEVMSRLFEHFHSQLTGGIVVTSVRVKGDQAYALLGSPTMPASDILLVRNGTTWRVMGIFGGPLP